MKFQPKLKARNFIPLASMIFCSILPSQCKKTELKQLILPSGNRINVLGVKHVKAVLRDGTITFPKLEYESYIDIEDSEELYKELREIWPIFLKDLERTQFDFAQISAFPADTKIIKRNRQIPFSKGSDGIWRSPALKTSLADPVIKKQREKPK